MCADLTDGLTIRNWPVSLDYFTLNGSHLIDLQRFLSAYRSISQSITPIRSPNRLDWSRGGDEADGIEENNGAFSWMKLECPMWWNETCLCVCFQNQLNNQICDWHFGWKDLLLCDGTIAAQSRRSIRNHAIDVVNRIMFDVLLELCYFRIVADRFSGLFFMFAPNDENTLLCRWALDEHSEHSSEIGHLDKIINWIPTRSKIMLIHWRLANETKWSGIVVSAGVAEPNGWRVDRSKRKIESNEPVKHVSIGLHPSCAHGHRNGH